MRKCIDSKSIPTLKLLIKDHKPLLEDGSYPSWMVVLATNFWCTFSEAGYKGIKSIFDARGINYGEKSIAQASDLKNQMENLNLC